MSARIAVVGAGMAAARFAQQLAEHGADAEVTLYGGEPVAPYNRALVADVLTGLHRPADLALPTGEARVRTGNEVVALDVAGRTLRLADGSEEPYDDVVLATGANPVLPPLRGLFGPDGGLRPGLHALRSLADCARIAADAATARR
ncbi:FAD-dependent oxidoreductase, partial [Streptomyces sp. SID11385]|uniref:FAD-dependent oxidoreductase n=1 Tax=Streptomyces sp. SID11385 TaxID=2706031 RepID=UPI0013C656A4